VFDKMTARRYFVKTGRGLLRWDVDDSNNIMGAFLGVGGMTPDRVKRLERYKSYGRLYAG
jgi:hypothetical protein